MVSSIWHSYYLLIVFTLMQMIIPKAYFPKNAKQLFYKRYFYLYISKYMDYAYLCSHNKFMTHE